MSFWREPSVQFALERLGNLDLCSYCTVASDCARWLRQGGAIVRGKKRDSEKVVIVADCIVAQITVQMRRRGDDIHDSSCEDKRVGGVADGERGPVGDSFRRSRGP
jgi:hypothetical protein